jgi:hypothetical protein
MLRLRGTLRTVTQSLDKIENSAKKVEPSLRRDIPGETSATLLDDWLAILDRRYRSFTKATEASQPP